MHRKKKAEEMPSMIMIVFEGGVPVWIIKNLLLLFKFPIVCLYYSIIKFFILNINSRDFKLPSWIGRMKTLSSFRKFSGTKMPVKVLYTPDCLYISNGTDLWPTQSAVQRWTRWRAREGGVGSRGHCSGRVLTPTGQKPLGESALFVWPVVIYFSTHERLLA